MIRKVRFSIKLKLSLLIIFLIIFSILFYLLYALNLFEKDKSAYIYENNLSLCQHISSQVDLYFKSNLNKLKTWTKISSRSSLKTLMKENKDILFFAVFQDDNGSFQEQYKLSSDSRFSSISLITLNSIKQTKLELKNITKVSSSPTIRIGYYDQGRRLLSIGIFNISKLMDILGSDSRYTSYVLDEHGEPFLYKDNFKSFLKQAHTLELIFGEMKNGVKEFTYADGEQHLVAFNKISSFNLYTITQIKRQKAFQAAHYLMDQTIYLALLVISISIIIGLLFARPLTSNIRSLFMATQKISKGDFAHRVSIKALDEMGVLADSFNYMSEEISKYMLEMKEKARVENELALAHLVQKTFFPKSEIKLEGVELAAYFQSASECGGDWWGYLTFKDKVIVVLADATGHGMSAALLTATISCSINNLKTLINYDELYSVSPSHILNFINRAVLQMQGKIMLTCFVGIIDTTKNILAYANASHNPPIIYQNKSFRPLMCKQGPRLGHQSKSAYSENICKINKNDFLVMYTDGLLENCNLQGKEWGQRRFIKCLSQNIKHNSSTIIRDQIIREVQNFYQSSPLKDDITLVLAQIK